MSRYIDADKLKERLREKIQSFIKERGVSINAMFDYERGRVNEIENCILMISEAPTIDAVEVVRCKDCNYFKRCDEVIWWCGKWGRHMADTEAKPTYCGWGKRDRP